jgi:hypothetical protein
VPATPPQKKKSLSKEKHRIPLAREVLKGQAEFLAKFCLPKRKVG